jgi:hypothetical protein
VSSFIVVTYSLLVYRSASWSRNAYLILQLATVRILACNKVAQTMSALKSCFYVAVLFFALSAEAIKLSNFNAASFVKRSHLMNAQIATAQLALSAAIIFGIPASSLGKTIQK